MISQRRKFGAGTCSDGLRFRGDRFESAFRLLTTIHFTRSNSVPARPVFVLAQGQRSGQPASGRKDGARRIAIKVARCRRQGALKACLTRRCAHHSPGERGKTKPLGAALALKAAGTALHRCPEACRLRSDDLTQLTSTQINSAYPLCRAPVQPIAKARPRRRGGLGPR